MYQSLDDIRTAEKKAGGYWFDSDTMRFFNSRVSRKIYPNAYGAYFVSSERYNFDGERRYTVRWADSRGHVFTVGEFGAYATRGSAHKAAERYQNAFMKRPKRQSE